MALREAEKRMHFDRRPQPEAEEHFEEERMEARVQGYPYSYPYTTFVYLVEVKKMVRIQQKHEVPVPGQKWANLDLEKGAKGVKLLFLVLLLRGGEVKNLLNSRMKISLVSP